MCCSPTRHYGCSNPRCSCCNSNLVLTADFGKQSPIQEGFPGATGAIHKEKPAIVGINS
ncbi:hypothetical protein PAHAL_4G127000 [Panicum hallii]|uniref:Uncharacterized protein n=1 Tax=Panicum hallii TaxID=206008 RepID=A0A2T8JCR4_9POAL|nr:hypothetical protein PAHAL_4G127000 [Panicum hallii]